MSTMDLPTLMSSIQRNPGIPLDLDWVESVRVNRSAVERRATTLPGRRTVKKEWQVAWLAADDFDPIEVERNAWVSLDRRHQRGPGPWWTCSDYVMRGGFGQLGEIVQQANRPDTVVA